MSFSKLKDLGERFKFRLVEFSSNLSENSEGKPGPCDPVSTPPNPTSSPTPAPPSSSPPPESSTMESFDASSEEPHSEMERRPMKYPYTLSAKLAQFPLRYYMTHVWMWKYYFVAVGLTLPLFYKIGKLSKSPENVAKWNEIRKKEFTGGHH